MAQKANTSEMDSIYLIDHEYESFSQALQDLLLIIEQTSLNSSPDVEMFRLSFKNLPNSWTIQNLPRMPAQIGWIYSIDIRQPEEILALNETLRGLHKSKIPFKLSDTPFGKAHDIEIRYLGNEAVPFLTIPFEDQAKNASRFFSRFIPALSSGFGVSPKALGTKLELFYEHVEKFLGEEKPFHASFSRGLLLGRKTLTYTWTPRVSHVGRHMLFKEFEISEQVSNEAPLHLLQSLANLAKKDAQGDRRLYLQYFEQGSLVVPFRPTPLSHNVFEFTAHYDHLSFHDSLKLVHQIPSTKPQLEVSDCFIVFDQPNALLAESCAITYTLRKTVDQGFEIRVNPVWKNSTFDPEEAVKSLENEIGKNWAMIRSTS